VREIAYLYVATFQLSSFLPHFSATITSASNLFDWHATSTVNQNFNQTKTDVLALVEFRIVAE